MTTTATYQASSIKRQRSTKAEVEARRDALFWIVQAGRPMTVRQDFYQATVQGTRGEGGVGLCQDWRRPNGPAARWRTALRLARRQHAVAKEAANIRDVQETAKFYRKALWNNSDAYVEIWLEKDALSGVVFPVAAVYDVPLMVARGYASLSFLYSAAEFISSLAVPTFIYHFGDFDPSGVNASEKIEETLREMAPQAEIIFERLAVTEEQIEEWDLPTRPTKKSDTRAKGFGSISVELDAIEPNRLREIVRQAIEMHLPPEQFAIIKEAEKSERDIVTRLVGNLTSPEKPR